MEKVEERKLQLDHSTGSALTAIEAPPAVDSAVDAIDNQGYIASLWNRRNSLAGIGRMFTWISTSSDSSTASSRERKASESSDSSLDLDEAFHLVEASDYNENPVAEEGEISDGDTDPILQASLTLGSTTSSVVSEDTSVEGTSTAKSARQQRKNSRQRKKMREQRREFHDLRRQVAQLQNEKPQ